MTRSQQGVTHSLVVLLVVVVLVAIGGAGYVVYQRNRAVANSTQQGTPDIVYLPLDGWEVSLQLENDVRDAELVAAQSTDRFKTVTTPRLRSLANGLPACQAASTVELMRVLPGEIVDGKSYDIDGLEDDEAYQRKGEYYYHVKPEAECPTAAGSGATELNRLRAELAKRAIQVMTTSDIEQGNHEGHENSTD